MSSTSPTHIRITPSEIIPYSWDVSDLLGTGETIGAVAATLTRIVPLPETDVTADILLDAPSVTGNFITIGLNGSLMTLNSVYRLEITFQPNPDTTLAIQSFIYCQNANPYPVQGLTLRELRQRCGTMLNDMFMVEATEDGTPTSFVDTNTITLPTGELKNRIIYFIGGQSANINVQRTIDSNVTSSGTLYWQADLPAATKRGDRAELWNHRAQGIRPLQMNDFINIAHSEASVYNHVLMTITITDDFDSAEPNNTITVPSGVSKIERVQYLSNDQVWIDVPKGAPGGPGYWVDVYNRVLTIGRPMSTYAGGAVVRLLVRGRENPLVNDDDTTIINAEWLCARACELACTALVNRNPDQNVYRDKMYKYERIAQSMRTLIVPRARAGTMLEW